MSSQSPHQYHGYEKAVYNKSLKTAYADLLMEKMSRANSMAAGSAADNMEDFEMGMIEDGDDDENNSYYKKFKRSILNDAELGESLGTQNVVDKDVHGDAWLDDNSTLDQDYSSEADKSFYEDDEEDEDREKDGESIVATDEDSEYYDDYRDDGNDEEEWSSSSKRMILIALFFLGLLCIGPLFNAVMPSTSGQSSVRSASTMPALQKQINHLYSEIDHRDQKSRSDLEKTIKVIINQFEKKIRELLPSNVASLKNQLESLTNKVNQLSLSLSKWERKSSSIFTMDNITEWQAELAKELESHLPQEIPVIMNNSSTMLVIPEMNDYLQNLIASLMQHSNARPDNSTLQYDLNLYVKEILADQFQYIDKDYFIRELNRNLQISKQEIWQEMASRLDQWQKERPKEYSEQNVIPRQYSSILLKKLINQIYNTNEHQWEDNLDFATFAQGTKLLNHLTSKTWNQGTGVSPIELLQDSKYGPSTYWQCGEPQKCSWAIRFQEAIYLTRLSYMHGRFNNNLHAMNSAPKLISVYVKIAKTNGNVDARKIIALAQKFNQGQKLSLDSQFIRIGQYPYSLTDTKIRQVLPLPSWFIQLKTRVRAVVFAVDQNYGNKRYTSLKKFTVNAVTQEDLSIMESNSFQLRCSGTPEYASSSITNDIDDMKETVQGSDDVNQPHKSRCNVPAFGQDELIP